MKPQDVPSSTFCYRNIEQLEVLSRLVKQMYNQLGRVIKVKLFACSTGKEAVSLATYLHDLGLSKCVRIEASDYKTECIEEAKQFLVTRKDFYRAPKNIRSRYFKVKVSGEIALSEEIAHMIDYYQEDIFSARDAKYDVVICQNMLIHYKPDKIKKLFNILLERCEDYSAIVVGGGPLNIISSMAKDNSYYPLLERVEGIHEGWAQQRAAWKSEERPFWALEPFDLGQPDDFCTIFTSFEVKPVIEFSNVTFSYSGAKTPVLSNCSFTIYENEMVGVVGRNGAGKTTLTRLLAGIYEADEGVIRRHSEVTLFSIGVGFQNHLTGEENVYLSGALLGFSRSFISQKLSAIKEFSELGEYFTQPVKTYSSGMRARLSFSVGALLSPEVLVLDEVLATGDPEFKKKAEVKMQELMHSAKAVVVVTHQMKFATKYCDRILVVDNGSVNQVYTV